MKTGVHPKWFHDCAVTCGCGNTFVTGSGTPTLKVDICYKCHPFFTGEMKFVDRQGRLERFVQKMKAAQVHQAQMAQKQTKKAAKAGKGKSYQEILREQQSELRKAETVVTKVAAKSDAKASAVAVSSPVAPVAAAK